MDIVSSMNAVFSCFDKLMDKYNVYKVMGDFTHLSLVLDDKKIVKKIYLKIKG